MKVSYDQPKWVFNSPWLDSAKSNLFRDQFKLIADLKIDIWLKEMGAYFTPIEIYQWVYDHQGEDLFFRGLAKLAPMVPLIAYQKQISVWLSPPLSGMGNAIYMVMGHDKKGQLRLVGGNYFTEPLRRNVTSINSKEFFEKYDKTDKRNQLQLVKEAVENSIQIADTNLLMNIRRECEHFNTMPVYITALCRNEGSLFHAGKAVIEGDKPADFSYEFFGEIK